MILRFALVTTIIGFVDAVSFSLTFSDTLGKRAFDILVVNADSWRQRVCLLECGGVSA